MRKYIKMVYIVNYEQAWLIPWTSFSTVKDGKGEDEGVAT
jgi:hypothetical protein